jgi:hypothetical protein
VFDNYLFSPIKNGTEVRWKEQIAAMKHMSSRNVPLPSKWANFIAHECSKEIFVRFLSQQLILQIPADQRHYCSMKVKQSRKG